jgi:hypothetical protein
MKASRVWKVWEIRRMSPTRQAKIVVDSLREMSDTSRVAIVSAATALRDACRERKAELGAPIKAELVTTKTVRGARQRKGRAHA